MVTRFTLRIPLFVILGGRPAAHWPPVLCDQATDAIAQHGAVAVLREMVAPP